MSETALASCVNCIRPCSPPQNTWKSTQRSQEIYRLLKEHLFSHVFVYHHFNLASMCHCHQTEWRHLIVATGAMLIHWIQLVTLRVNLHNAIWRSDWSPSDCVVMQRDIDILHSLSRDWQMNFNAKKCHTMCITRKHTEPLLSYELDQENLSTVDSYPYLGVIILSDLCWNLHVNHISSRATRVLNPLQQNFYLCCRH